MLDGTLGVHPTFLYESLWNVIGFVLINLVYKKKRFDGQILLMYVTWYGFGRMFIELLRTDSLTNGNNIRVSSLLGLLSFVVGGALLLYLFIKNKGKKTFGNAVATATASAEATVINNADAEAEETDAKESVEADNEENTESQEEQNTESNEETNDGKLD